MVVSFILFPRLSIWLAHIIGEEVFLTHIHITRFHYISSFLSGVICEYFYLSPVLSRFISPPSTSCNPTSTHINFLITIFLRWIILR